MTHPLWYLHTLISLEVMSLLMFFEIFLLHEHTGASDTTLINPLASIPDAVNLVVPSKPARLFIQHLSLSSARRTTITALVFDKPSRHRWVRCTI